MTHDPKNKDVLCCYDCGRAYREYAGFADLHIPDEYWDKIAPKPEGGGMLCPSCMVSRATHKGLSNVPAKFTSGPFMTRNPADGGAS